MFNRLLSPAKGGEPDSGRESFAAAPEPRQTRTEPKGKGRQASFSTVILFIILLDLSESVIPDKEELIKAYSRSLDEVGNDTIAATMVRHSLITFSTETKATPFAPIRECKVPALEFGGNTSGWTALKLLCTSVVEEKRQLAAAGRHVLKTIAFLLTDAGFNDQPEMTPSLVHATEREQKLNLYPIVVGKDPNMELANRLSSKRKALPLDPRKFKELFSWMSESVILTSRTHAGESLTLSSTDEFRQCD